METTGDQPGMEQLECPGLAASLVRDDGFPADIVPQRLDVEGLRILSRLHRYGHQAYFVGGCVRDLLLVRSPKDFDIATSAHPGEVRSLFRNCRLIGRRFRLAHVYFRGGKIIEVATFRANPMELEEGEDLPDDLLITRDNVFGTAEQDALRRDFTINGLFYDVRLGRVIDFVEGRKDVEQKTIRTIGNPEIRMREDPVRILRAVRFASRLQMRIEPQTYAAMNSTVGDLSRCAPARLLEEVFRLLRSGASRQAFKMLYSLGALELLLPPVAKHLRKTGESGINHFFSRLGALDARTKLSRVDDSVIVAMLLFPLAQNQQGKGCGSTADSLLENMVQTARLSRRLADRTRQLLWAQGVLVGENRRRRSLSSFRSHPMFLDSLLLLELDAEATGESRELVEKWRTGALRELSIGDGNRRRKRRPRGGRNSSDKRSISSSTT